MYPAPQLSRTACTSSRPSQRALPHLPIARSLQPAFHDQTGQGLAASFRPATLQSRSRAQHTASHHSTSSGSSTIIARSWWISHVNGPEVTLALVRAMALVTGLMGQLQVQGSSEPDEEP